MNLEKTTIKNISPEEKERLLTNELTKVRLDYVGAVFENKIPPLEDLGSKNKDFFFFTRKVYSSL